MPFEASHESSPGAFDTKIRGGQARGFSAASPGTDAFGAIAGITTLVLPAFMLSTARGDVEARGSRGAAHPIGTVVEMA